MEAMALALLSVHSDTPLMHIPNTIVLSNKSSWVDNEQADDSKHQFGTGSLDVIETRTFSVTTSAASELHPILPSFVLRLRLSLLSSGTLVSHCLGSLEHNTLSNYGGRRDSL